VALNFGVVASSCTAKGGEAAAASVIVTRKESVKNDLAAVNCFVVATSFLSRVSTCDSQVITAAIWVYCPTLLS